MPTFKKIMFVVMAAAYIIAGVNHFINPQVYLPLIPHYLPLPVVLNILAGFCEITFGLLLFFNKTRKVAAWLIILMLIAFIPVHIDMIRNAPFVMGRVNVSTVFAWVRLPLQGVLIWWAWLYTRHTV
jgi:uncharacterized membrane protein